MFVVSLREYFWPICYGSRVVFAEPGIHRDPDVLYKTILRKNITICHFVPALMRVFLDLNKDAKISSLRLIFTGGEKIDRKLVIDYLKQFNVKLYAFYGLTETTGGILCQNLHDKIPLNYVPMGNVIANTRIYILDENLNEVSYGQPGELCVSGSSLGYYLSRSDLNEALFITNPFDVKDSPLFKTGDIVIRMKNGDLKYLHRKDREFKIRGIRVDPTTIEQQIELVPEVEKAIIIKYEVGDRVFIASYMTLTNIQSLNSLGKNNLIQKIRDVLLKKLPQHLLPATFDLLEKMPLNLRGKIDYKALPAPNLTERVVETTYEAPTNKIEEYLVELWQDYLRKEKIGVNDHFISLGGDSLQSVQIVNRINKDFSSSVVSLPQFMENPTVKKLNLVIQKNSTKNDIIPIYQIHTDGEDSNTGVVEEDAWFPLSYGQIFHYFARRVSVFRNIGFKLHMRGSLDSAILEQCINILLERHPALRLQISIFSPKQRVTNHRQFKLQTIDISHLTKDQMMNEIASIWQSTIDSPVQLATPTKLSARLFILSKTDFLLQVCIPHIVCDGMALQILRDELMYLYNSLSEGSTPKLRKNTTHYFDFIREEISEQEDAFSKSVDFWSKVLEADDFLIADPNDINCPPRIKNNILCFEFNANLLVDFQEFCQKNYYTHSLVLNAIFALTIAKQFQKKSIVFINYDANRSDRKYEYIIGEFESQNIHKFKIDENLSLSEFLENVKAVTLERMHYNWCTTGIPFIMAKTLYLRDHNFWFSPVKAVCHFFMKLFYGGWRILGSFAEVISAGVASILAGKRGRKKSSKNQGAQNNSDNEKQLLIIVLNVFPSLFAPISNYDCTNLSVKFERSIESFSNQLDQHSLVVYLDKNDSGNLVLMLNGPVNDEKKSEFSRSFVEIMEQITTDPNIKVKQCIF